MRILGLLAAVGLFGCGPKAAVCTATFSGNFADASTGSCPSLEPLGAGFLFRFEAQAPAVNSTLRGSIELAGPVPSTSSSQAAILDWSAVLTREPGCVTAAGKGAVPAGTFQLRLDVTEPPHGTLELTAYVHALPMADCGRGDVETLRLEF